MWPPLSLPHTRRTLSSLAPASVPAPDTPSPPLPPLEYVTYPAPREGAHEGPPRAPDWVAVLSDGLDGNDDDDDGGGGGDGGGSDDGSADGKGHGIRWLNGRGARERGQRRAERSLASDDEETETERGEAGDGVTNTSGFRATWRRPVRFDTSAASWPGASEASQRFGIRWDGKPPPAMTLAWRRAPTLS